MTIDQSIHTEKLIEAPPSTVFAYLTSSEKWAKWQGNEATIEPRVGGLFRMVMGNGMIARGQFLALVPNKKIVFTWGWVDRPGVPPGSSTVEIDLIDRDGSTLLKLKHSGLVSEEIPFHRQGWEHYLTRLSVASRGIDPGPDTGPG